MWKELISFFAFAQVAYGATLYHCQDGSSCQLPGHIEATSFEFLSKFTQKQYRTVVSLTMSNASINKVDPKLKYLKNLQYLDLSHNNVQISSLPSLANLKTLKLNGNNLKSINMSALPQNLEILDISHNLLAQIPRDWRSLKSLMTLHLYKNPIDCDCNNVLTYDRLVKSVMVPEIVTCHSPKKYAGKDISAVNCSLDDIMLYDEPDLGSGDIVDDVTEEMLNVPVIQEKEDEVIDDSNTYIDDKVYEDDPEAVERTEDPFGAVLEEGSGDEGSGFSELSGVLGCIEKCSTPGPVGGNDEEHASPLPNVIEQAKIIFEDLDLLPEAAPSTSTTTSTTTTVRLIDNTITNGAVVEPQIVRKVQPKAEKTPSKKDDVEVVEHNTKTGELERAQAGPQNSTAVYAIVGVGLFLAVIFIICFIKKRQAKKKDNKRREIPNSFGEELKPLSKHNQNSNEKPVKNVSNLPEHVPLINGQNGKPKDDTPALKSFTPLEHPETVQEEEELEQEQLQNDASEDVEIRPKSVPELLTPQRERVTIKETEIPDSIPKTPLLVHRQRNSDGEIVTTLVP